MKTNKSYTKRLRVTRTGKILARKGGKNHFNAKENRRSQMAGKRSVDFVIKNKPLSRFMPNLVNRNK